MTVATGIVGLAVVGGAGPFASAALAAPVTVSTASPSATAKPLTSAEETPTVPVARAAATTTSFTTALAAAWRSYLSERPGSISVALYDRNSGQTVYVTKNTRAGWETASTVKLDILTDLLSKTGTSGKLTSYQMSKARPMISVSDNSAATALWKVAGGTAGMNAFYRKLGMTSTSAGTDGYWGLTLTTALDQLRVLRAVAYPGPHLSANARATAAGLLDTVIPSQHWGLSAGVPSGVTVELKNGWLPHGEGWVVNSLARVEGDGKDYVMAVYTRDSATERTGINTISGLSRLAWAAVPAV
jgi:hypothetical protein